MEALGEYDTFLGGISKDSERVFATCTLVPEVRDWGNGALQDMAASKIGYNRGLAKPLFFHERYPLESQDVLQAVLNSFPTTPTPTFFPTLPTIPPPEIPKDEPYVAVSELMGQPLYKGIHPVNGTFDRGGWEACVALWKRLVSKMVDGMNAKSKHYFFRMDEIDHLRPTIVIRACERIKVSKAFAMLCRDPDSVFG